MMSKSIRNKQTPCQSGLILTQEDCPIIPDAKRQKYYLSFVAKLQFAASWVRFDISFAVAQPPQLARFCASAGPSHWAALHHLMEYLDEFSSFKLTYRRRSALSNCLSGYCDSEFRIGKIAYLPRSTTGN